MVSSTGWSLDWLSRSTMRSWTPASAAASRQISSKSASDRWCEHEKGSRVPPRSSSRRARRVISLYQRAAPSAVPALVAEETRLGADADCHPEGPAAFVHPNAPGPGAPGPPEGRRKPPEPRGSFLVHVEDEPVTEHIGQSRDDRRPQACHSQGETLSHEDGPIAVDHQSGQPVGLAPDEAAERRRPLGAVARAQGNGALEAAPEEGGVERLGGPGEDAAAEGGARVVEAR